MSRVRKSAHPGKHGIKTLVYAVLLGSVTNLPALAYDIVDLGANVSPKDINNNGIVVGVRNTDQYPTNAFRYVMTSGQFEDLDGTVAHAVNDAGEIAGSTLSGAFILEGGNYRAWDDQAAYGISELGEAAGNKAGKNPYRATSIPYNPAVYTGNKWTVMDIAQVYPRGTRQGVYADILTLFDINDNGYAVGSRRRYGLAGSSAILITPPYSDVSDLGDVTYLPTSYGGVANAINNQNIIVGTTGNDSRSGTYSYAFLYDGNTVDNLGTLPGGFRSSASDINEQNLVVGSSESNTGYHAFIWTEQDGINDLNEEIATAGWVLSSAVAVNDLGDIVGTGLLHGATHGFVLTKGPAIPPPGNHPPVAVAESDMTSGKAPLTVSFFGDKSSDPDDDTLSFTWDFGDGTSSSDGMSNQTYIYNIPGTYIAALTVTDSQGITATADLEITVRKSRGKPGK